MLSMFIYVCRYHRGGWGGWAGGRAGGRSKGGSIPFTCVACFSRNVPFCIPGSKDASFCFPGVSILYLVYLTCV